MNPAKSTPQPFGWRDWTDVEEVLRAVIFRKWGHINPEDMDDATQTAMLDLVDYWVNLDSVKGNEDPDQNFRYAVQRGYWTATTWLSNVYEERQVNLTYEQAYMRENDDDSPNAAQTDIFEDRTQPSPEEQVVQKLEEEEVRRAIAESDPKELSPWLEDYLSDQTVTQVAERLGISHQAVSKRWRKGLKRLAERMAHL